MLFVGSIILQVERELHSVNTLKHNKDISFISICYFGCYEETKTPVF